MFSNMQKPPKTAAYSKINPCCVGLRVSDIVSPVLLKTHRWQLVPTVQRKPFANFLVRSDIHVLKLKCVKRLVIQSALFNKCHAKAAAIRKQLLVLAKFRRAALHILPD